MQEMCEKIATEKNVFIEAHYEYSSELNKWVVYLFIDHELVMSKYGTEENIKETFKHLKEVLS